MDKVKQTPLIFLLYILSISLVFGSGSALAFDGSVTEEQDIFKSGYIEAIGESEAGQSRYAAIRAATVVAQRNLLEEMKGVRVQGETTIADGMLQSDIVKNQVTGFLRGARLCGRTYHPQERYGEVCLRIYLKGHGGMYSSLYKTLKDQKIVTTDEEAPIPVKDAHNVMVDSDFDGVIIMMSGLSFKPAIVNRILNNKGEVIFDPSRVVNAILIERGTGGFTNQEGKAKGLLASWNGLRPLVINAVDTKQGTDAVISDSDAATMLSADQKNSFLSQAKVVFVIN
ncbi:MAG: hypothetical protein HQL70_01940 [Magnetococcales bacterium]|nr:hypothetical protein [Magnetococcales bacterium]